VPLPNLATADDVAAYGYDPIDDVWLKRASTRIRAEIKQTITPSVNVATFTGFGPWLLPERPVVSLDSIVDEKGNTITRYKFSNSLLDIWQRPYQIYEDRFAQRVYTVNYHSGFTVVPDAIIELTCSVARRLSQIPSGVAMGARTEQAGGEAVTWGVEAFNGATALTAAEEEVLHDVYPCRPRSRRLI
jgi:hypothetical protein